MERSRDWMDQAERDLQHARSDVDGGYYEWACFSAQQAAEKAVKAVGSVRVFYPAFDKAGLLRMLREGLARLRATLPLSKVVLFGSYARGTHTVGSDVDLLVVYCGEPRPDAYVLVKRALAVPRLEPHVYTEAEYEAARSTVDRMVRGGLTLLGA